jgi:sulfate transport system permease protein
VISGLVFVLLFGLQGWFGHWLLERASASFCAARIILATMFVTFRMWRRLIPLMQQLGNGERGRDHLGRG